MYGMMTQEEALRKLQGIELEIMLSVGELCRENDITWFMDSGTALGAIRHRGFIPWTTMSTSACFDQTTTASLRWRRRA